MIDNVATGPVTLHPGDNGKIDDRAWQAFEQLAGHCPCSYMLMSYEPSGRFGRLTAAFKHRATRIYRRVTFGYSSPDPATREPEWETLRDYCAQLSWTRELGDKGIGNSGGAQVLRELRERHERLTGEILAPDCILRAAGDEAGRAVLICKKS